MLKYIATVFFVLITLSPAQAATVIYDDGNFGGSFNGDDLGTLQIGQSLVRGSNDGTCLPLAFGGGIDCVESTANDDLQSGFTFDIAAGSRLDSIIISAGGFGPASLRTTFRIDFPLVPVFDSNGQQVTRDFPLFIDGLTIGESDQLLTEGNVFFLFPEAKPEIPFAGPAAFDVSIFSGNSDAPGRFGVQWEMTLTVAPAAVPLPAGMLFLLTGIGALAWRKSRAADGLAA
jgi:hypothetical protein